jgi:hypothetical protein
VHAAFRRDLARYDAALAGFPPRSQERADQLKRAWDFFDGELHHHHAYEEEYFWPALQQTDADLSALAQLDAEHEDMRAALLEATSAMGRLQQEPTADRAAEARQAVAHLGEVLLGHLDHEESDLEPVSVSYADSPPMRAALKQVKRANLRYTGNFVLWLQDGATAADRAGLRREIPGPGVWVFGAIAGRRYRREVAPVWAG